MESIDLRQEGLNEWLVADEENMKFHLGQIDNPYRSTLAFDKFLAKEGVDLCKSTTIFEAGCGAGQVLGYFLTKYDELKGYGIDLNGELVDYGNKVFENKGLNGKLKVDDLYNFSDEVRNIPFDGIMLLQVINIIPEYENAVYSLQNLKHKWIAFSLLGFEGNIDYICTLHDYNKPKLAIQRGGYSKVFYNIWSLPRMKSFFTELGYKKFEYEKFEMDIDLPNEHPEGRGTYTVKLDDGSRMQISGGMWMPWYFVYAEK